MIHILIYLTIFLTKTNNTSYPNEKTKCIICLCLIINIRRFFASNNYRAYINQVLILPACKFLNFFMWNIKLINFHNIHFSVFHLYLLLVIKFLFKILKIWQLYFQVIHFLLPFSKSYFNLAQIFPWIFSSILLRSFREFFFSLLPKKITFIFWFSDVYYH